MKKIFKAFPAAILSLSLLGSSVFAEPKDFSEIMNNKDYEIVIVKAKDIHKDENGVITFKNLNEKDTNTYVIDSETSFYIPADDISDRGTLEQFLSGEMPYIDFYVRKETYYGYSLKQNETIHVEGVGSYFKNLIGVGTMPAEEPEDFGVLLAFDIMPGFENGKIPQGSLMTRGSMAETIAGMLRLKKAAENYGKYQIFSDVPTSSEQCGAVNMCKEMGCILGYGGGTFGLNDNITYAQAAKLLVSVLGYGKKAESLGGYPDGYIKIAKELGLTENTSFDPSAPALRLDVARMVKAAMYTPIMEQVSYAGENSTFEVKDGNDGRDFVRFYDKYYN